MQLHLISYCTKKTHTHTHGTIVLVMAYGRYIITVTKVIIFYTETVIKC